MTTTTGHTLTVDLETMQLTISGLAETMDAISDVELNAAARSAGVEIDWARGPLDETTYGLTRIEQIVLPAAEFDRLAELSES